MAKPKTPAPDRDEGDTRVDVSSVLTHSMEDYIKAIYKLQQHSGRATTIAIADEMGFSAASATNMLQKLARLELVSYAPYKGAELTATGRRIALEVIRHHRLIELYLAKHMGYSWDAVDAEAEALEHVISEEFEERIDELLGRPETDPHGHPIPSKDGHIPDERMYTPLADVPDGSSARVRRVSDRDPEALRSLGAIGLYPGADLLVLRRESADVVVRVGDDERPVSAEHAVEVFVELRDGSDTPS
ncbi:metal-dependent transcriptional regulator [Candidatus Poribacteria bacterium]|jgi:DtxR family transcriptional regulator, Mn-dependent transcriptional regulator|nr:metal-dependent transcriptional regulator [Candidatus Poribacteria bacterium]MBT5536380.1 metal-dependent transcriptional regulator [Candidatus Poribacteria bacterium]MBT7805454.1 metal-dependent transcriptional regulator [Candidatus Poribacteria bacterium]